MSGLRQRFDERWVPEPFSGCHLWTAGAFGTGYGSIHDGDKHWKAHRLSWTLNRGEIPNGLHVLHRCDTRLCVNPDHLFLGTNADNIRDAIAKGRKTNPIPRFGENHPKSRLTARAVNFIRRASSVVTNRALAGEFGVSVTAVRLARVGLTWPSDKMKILVLIFACFAFSSCGVIEGFRQFDTASNNPPARTNK